MTLVRPFLNLIFIVFFLNFNHGISPYLAVEDQTTSCTGSSPLVGLPNWTLCCSCGDIEVDSAHPPKPSFFRSEFCAADSPCPTDGKDDLAANRMVVSLVPEDEQSSFLALRFFVEQDGKNDVLKLHVPNLQDADRAG